MALTMMGTKLGMTRVFDDEGRSVPVSIIRLGPNVVTQIRTEETDGYNAVQIAYGQIKPRNSTIPMIVHDHKAGTTPKRHHREFRVSAEELAGYEPGQELTVSRFVGAAYVDVIGTSKGKGFAGVMKLYGFKGQIASHGVERKHRSAGSIGGHAANRGGTGGIKKGKKMAGRMGGERVTVRSVDVIRLDEERGLLLVKGPVPGPAGGLLMVREAVRLYRSKGARQAEMAAG